MREFVQEPMKTRSMRDLRRSASPARGPCRRGRARPPRARPGRRTRRVGDAAVDRRDHRRVRPPGDLRDERRDVDLDRRGRRPRPGRCAERATRRAPLPGGALRRARAALEVGEGRVVGRDHPGAGAALDRHVADVMRPSIESASIAGPVYSIDVADAAGDADLADRAEHEVLRGHAERQLADEADPHRLRPRLQQRLRGEHVLDLARCRCRTRARRRRRAWRCASRRTRSSSPAGSARAPGPITCTIPSRPLRSRSAGRRTPRSCAASASSWAFASGSRIGPGSVGTLWSIVAIVRSGRRTGRPASRSVEACGEVTSWTRCRSM